MKFRKVTVQHVDVFKTAKDYAKEYVKRMDENRNNGERTWDVDCEMIMRPSQTMSRSVHEIRASETVQAYLDGASDDSDDNPAVQEDADADGEDRPIAQVDPLPHTGA